MFNFNLKRLIYTSFIIAIRGNLVELLYCMLYSLKSLHFQFYIFRSNTAKVLTYNAQYPNLQRLLNDKFDNISRSIKVYDGDPQFSIIIYPTSNETEVVTPQILYTGSNYLSPLFIIDVPVAFQNQQNIINQINKTVLNNIFLGTNFKMIYS